MIVDLGPGGTSPKIRCRPTARRVCCGPSISTARSTVSVSDEDSLAARILAARQVGCRVFANSGLLFATAALRTKLNISSAEPAHGRRRLQKECKAVAKCSAHPTTGQACIKCNTTVGAPTYDCLECCPGCKPTTSGAFTYCDCTPPPAPAPNPAKGALAYLKHDALGPQGDACESSNGLHPAVSPRGRLTQARCCQRWQAS